MEDAGILNSVRNVLLRQPDIELACVFGSFAQGGQTPASDIAWLSRRKLQSTRTADWRSTTSSRAPPGGPPIWSIYTVQDRLC